MLLRDKKRVKVIEGRDVMCRGECDRGQLRQCLYVGKEWGAEGKGRICWREVVEVEGKGVVLEGDRIEWKQRYGLEGRICYWRGGRWRKKQELKIVERTKDEVENEEEVCSKRVKRGIVKRCGCEERRYVLKRVEEMWCRSVKSVEGKRVALWMTKVLQREEEA